ncbi:hypothetical protein LEP1GSC186_0979 [Leptospira noguchii serovar Autumnalis str. ZUN142]|uniref:Uncharacterized protein n=1 Tax=Leptospira noguchii serovar Autumnalis str. ZUN142 TaxID=1085540 RepID=M6UPD3_9LEPT|nr:hypothetical protein LEP1GSC186_0979 [Leptospira noguchii serovar Autumnalis str. ZUN142]
MGGIHFSEFVFLPFSDSIYFYGKKLFCFATRNYIIKYSIVYVSIT